jgi:hypothetical protein
LLLLSITIITLGTTAAKSEATGVADQEFDLLPILQKLPRVAPFIASKFDDDMCQTKFNEFKVDTDNAAMKAGIELPTEAILKVTACRIPQSCVQKFADTFKKMLNQGGLIEKVSREYFGGKKGVDIAKIDIILMEGVKNFCGWISAPQKAEL